ncbi:hypothetical protein HanHA300_Chr14g0541181 [Helianthus annuus]|nr:hypothetical protein HanHA300_Chr14g0541181 [Helianthus annuus]
MDLLFQRFRFLHEQILPTGKNGLTHLIQVDPVLLKGGDDDDRLRAEGVQFMKVG